jgi:hypothetical protein
MMVIAVTDYSIVTTSEGVKDEYEYEVSKDKVKMFN